MPRQRIYSVHQRSTITPSLERELGQFTDDGMADQAIDALYRYAWRDISAGVASLMWFDPGLREVIRGKGYDRWAVDDKHAESPIFFKKPHDLWNQVPPSSDDFKFTQEVVDGGNVEVVGVKRLF